MAENHETSQPNTPECLNPSHYQLLGLKENDPFKDQIDAWVKNSYQKNETFFEQDIPQFKIQFVYTRPEFEQATGRKNTMNWSVGTSLGKEGLVIFHPSIYEQVSEDTHKLEDYPRLMTHEMTHTFQKNLYDYSDPIWLDEGVAGNVSEQVMYNAPLKTDRIKSFDQLHKPSGFYTPPTGYLQANRFTEYLINTFGKDKILTLLKDLQPKEDYSDFCTKFKQVYGIDLDTAKQDWVDAGIQNGTLKS
jgi:hypothetical protein